MPAWRLLAIRYARSAANGSRLIRLQIDPAKILHASQRFVYHLPMCVGDQLTGTKRIANIADRKNGALTFIDTAVEYRDAEGRPVCADHCSLVARNA